MKIRHITMATFLSLLILSPAVRADWRHWRGSARNGIVEEASGWPSGWTKKNVLWTTQVGEGASSPLVAEGRVYTMGWQSGEDSLFCFDALSGRELWRQSYACPKFGRHATGDQGLYSGPTSTPEFDASTGLLFTLSCDGDLKCWDTKKDGKQVWALNLYEKYGMERRPKVGRSGRRDYGYTTAPLVSGEQLIVEVGGKSGALMAFDKSTGRELWGSEAKGFAGHAGGLAPMTVQGAPCVAALTFNGLLVTRLDQGSEGKTAATFPWITNFVNNIAMPAVEGDSVLITSGYNQAAICRLKITLDGAKVVWKSEGKYSKTCTPVIFENKVYWAWNRLHCLDFATGKSLWTNVPTVGDAGSCVVTADKKLIVWCRRGDLILADTHGAERGDYKELARIRGLGSSDVWPHVAFSAGKIYCKDRQGRMTCLAVDGVKAKRISSAPSTPPAKAKVVFHRPEMPLDLNAWPGEDTATVLAWKRNLGAKLLGRAANDKSLKFETRGAAEFAKHGVLQLTKGAGVLTNAQQHVLAACLNSNELTIEATLSCDNVSQTGPARILSFSDGPYLRNFTLCQERSELIFRLRTSRTGENGMNPQTSLCRLKPNTPYHLLVTYRPGQLMCFLNGNSVKTSDAVQGDFSNWSQQHLLLGDEWRDSRFWSGSIERFAILSRFVGPIEAKRRYDLFRSESTSR